MAETLHPLGFGCLAGSPPQSTEAGEAKVAATSTFVAWPVLPAVMTLAFGLSTPPEGCDGHERQAARSQHIEGGTR